MMKDLTKVRSMRRKIEQTLGRSRGQTLGQVRRTIEKLIEDQGYHVLFPLNINPGKILAHSAPGPEDERILGAEDFTTIDYGYYDQSTMADCAITMVREESQRVLDDYRDKLEKIKNAIEKEYVQTGKIAASKVTRITQECLQDYTIIEQCCAHGFKTSPTELHTQLILMGHKKYPLRDDHEMTCGDSFTVEPHVTQSPRYRLIRTPGNICKAPEGPAHIWCDESKSEYPEISLRPEMGWYQEFNVYLDEEDGKRIVQVIGLGDRMVS